MTYETGEEHVRQNDYGWAEEAMNTTFIQRGEEDHTPTGIQKDNAQGQKS